MNSLHTPSLRKEASLVHLLAPGLAHLLQNRVASKQLRNPEFHTQMVDKLRQGLSKKTGLPLWKSFKHGITGGVVPEVSILGDSFHQVGKTLATKLPNGQLSPKDIVLARAVLKGETTSLQKLYNTPEFAQKIDSYLDLFNVPGADHIKKGLRLPNSPMKDSLLADAHALWKSNDLTGGLLSGIGDKLPELASKSGVVSPTIRPAKLTPELADYIGRGVGLAATTVADPITGGVSLFKHLYGNPHVHGDLMQKLRHVVEKKTMVDPMKSSFNRGVQGKTWNRFSQLGDKYGVNAITHEVNSLSHNAGELARKHLISPNA